MLADIDASHWRWGSGQADVVISCGDTPCEVILEAAAACRCDRAFAVKGNHDSTARFPAPIMDLHLRSDEHGGLRFGGCGGSWKYKPRGNYLYDQWEVAAFLSTFPPVDVFVSHNSPRGLHDQDDEVHCGFEALNDYIRIAKPRVLVHGHQHVNKETNVGETAVIGVFGHRILDLPMA